MSDFSISSLFRRVIISYKGERLIAFEPPGQWGECDNKYICHKWVRSSNDINGVELQCDKKRGVIIQL